jgi:hypothetical protein
MRPRLYDGRRVPVVLLEAMAWAQLSRRTLVFHSQERARLSAQVLSIDYPGAMPYLHVLWSNVPTGFRHVWSVAAASATHDARLHCS